MSKAENDMQADCKTLQEKAAYVANLIQESADKNNIELKLRKKAQ